MASEFIIFLLKNIQKWTSNLRRPYRHARAALGKVDHGRVELVFK